MTDRLRIAICGALLFVATHAIAQDDLTVNAITQTHDGYLWLGTHGGIERFDGWDLAKTPLGTTTVASVAADPFGALWIGTQTDGLYRSKAGTMTPVAGTGRAVHALANDRLHTIWAVSDDGIRRFDAFTMHPLSIANAPNTEARAVCAAGDDVWIGTDEGLFRYNGGAFTKLTSGVITALAADRDGTIWIGSRGGGLDVYANGAFTKPAAAAPLALTTISALAADRDGNVWIGPEDKGLCRLSADRLDCDRTTDTVRTIYEDREGTIWYGGTTGLRHLAKGVFVIPENEQTPHVVFRDRDGGLWTGSPAGLTHNGRTYTVYDGLASTWVRAIAQEPGGALWIGTSGGLSRFANGTITTIQSDGDADVRALAVDRDGRLWIGTTTGLRCIENGRLTRCGDEGSAVHAFDVAPDGTVHLAPNGAYGVVRDGQGNVWYSTAKAIFRGPSLVLSAASNDRVQPAAWRDTDGRLWFVTARAVVSIDPKRAGSKNEPPPVAVETRLGNRRVEFRYVALTFIEPQNVRYRTKLEGFDRGWSDVTANRVATYDDLPAGRFVFRVIAATSDGVWNRRGASVAIAVPPPFWRTWWFALLLAVAIAGVAFIALAVHRSNARLEKLATIDPLTRLANRRSLDAALRRRWAAAILCDIDHFKIYNDTFGHQAGDSALARVAQAIAASIDPAADFAARYGGEEFVVLLKRAEDAGHVAERIVEAVRALRIPHREGIVTVSAGVAIGDADDLIRRADEALYRAKANGRNRVEMADVVRAPSPSR
ncbi:MAG TPA: diguanylate cyclase [Thermoanaerobaculia bacterium]|nr:diguanylate cyclase [Thermoanaerobaculia bacterium]